ncbi:VOC family protein [Nocardiopsis coralliicola]
MDITWEALTVAAGEPLALAQWWGRTLGWDVVDPYPDGVEVRPRGGRGPSLFFIPAGGPGTGQNRLHLDLSVRDRAAAAEELVARGAAHADVGQPADAEWTVLRDPEGNEFCLLEQH